MKHVSFKVGVGRVLFEGSLFVVALPGNQRERNLWWRCMSISNCPWKGLMGGEASAFTGKKHIPSSSGAPLSRGFPCSMGLPSLQGTRMSGGFQGTPRGNASQFLWSPNNGVDLGYILHVTSDSM